MNELRDSLSVGSEVYRKGGNDPFFDYQQWRMRTTRLLWEADCAKEKGHVKKAEKLMSEAKKITRDYYDMRGIR